MLTIGRDKADMTLVLVTVGGNAHKKLLVFLELAMLYRGLQVTKPALSCALHG
jgi:hypothetical protein